MKLLLDTHIFLGYITGDGRLPSGLPATIRDPRSEVYLSVVSIWEAIVKYQLGKLPLPNPPESYLPRQRERHRIESLVLDEPSVAALARLPQLHKDPFDRIFVAQAIHHGLTLATVDDVVRRYPVRVTAPT